MKYCGCLQRSNSLGLIYNIDQLVSDPAARTRTRIRLRRTAYQVVGNALSCLVAWLIELFRQHKRRTVEPCFGYYTEIKLPCIHAGLFQKYTLITLNFSFLFFSFFYLKTLNYLFLTFYLTRIYLNFNFYCHMYKLFSYTSYLVSDTFKLIISIISQ